MGDRKMENHDQNDNHNVIMKVITQILNKIELY